MQVHRSTLPPAMREWAIKLARAGPAGSDRRVQVPRPPQDRRPRPDLVPEWAVEHATARAGLGEAAPLRRGAVAMHYRRER